jgi:putative flippase GtrA
VTIHTRPFAGLNAEICCEKSTIRLGLRCLRRRWRKWPRRDHSAGRPLSFRDLLPEPTLTLIARLPKGLLQFLAVGATGLAVHTASFTVVLQFGADKSIAWFAGLVTATVVTWSLNRKHTFSASSRRRRDEISRYALVTLVAQGISFAVFQLACRAAPHACPQACVLAGAVSATLFSYTGQRFFTFAPQRSVSYGA